MITERFAPVNFPVDGPEIGPIIIFKDMTPIYIKVNFLKWCGIGLSEVGASRQLEAKVIKHMETEFIGLINAFYCISVLMKDAFRDKHAIREQLQKYQDSYYIKDFKKKDFLLPFDFCKAFFEGITRESARSIIWLMMEVVVASKDKYEYTLEQKEILTLYERYGAVIDWAYDWQKALKKRNQSEKKKFDPNKNKKKK